MNPHGRLKERCFQEYKRCYARSLRVPSGPERAEWQAKAYRWAAAYDRVTDHDQGKHIGTRQSAAA